VSVALVVRRPDGPAVRCAARLAASANTRLTVIVVARRLSTLCYDIQAALTLDLRDVELDYLMWLSRVLGDEGVEWELVRVDSGGEAEAEVRRRAPAWVLLGRRYGRGPARIRLG